jgi:hypothetical protein
MPNVWEEEHGLNPDSLPASTDWNLDFDNDGYINVEEFINQLAEWPAPYDIVFTGGANARYEQITNWSITRPSPGESNTTTHWQPSKFDVAVINSGTVTVDSVGQHAGTIRLASGPSDNATLSITGGSLKVEYATVGPGNGEIMIGANPSATAQLNLSGGKLVVKTLNKGAGGQFNFTGGVLSAETINFPLENNGGTLAPGNSPGQTTINGNFTIHSGALEIELADASSYDTVFVNGNTALGGNLVVKLLDGFAPSQESSFTILSAPLASTISGTFTNLAPDNRLSIDGINGTFLVTIEPNWVTLSDFRDIPPVLAGDYNDDGIVDTRCAAAERDCVSRRRG